MQFLIGGAFAVCIIAFLFAFAAFLTWRDNRDMAKANREIHHVHQGALAGPYNSAQW